MSTTTSPSSDRSNVTSLSFLRMPKLKITSSAEKLFHVLKGDLLPRCPAAYLLEEMNCLVIAPRSNFSITERKSAILSPPQVTNQPLRSKGARGTVLLFARSPHGLAARARAKTLSMSETYLRSNTLFVSLGRNDTPHPN